MKENQKNLQKVPNSPLKSEVYSELLLQNRFLDSSKRLHSSLFSKMESSGFDDDIKEILRTLLRNFINPYNGEYLFTIFNKLNQKNSFRVDLLKEKVSDETILTPELKKIIIDSKKCLIEKFSSSGIKSFSIKRLILHIKPVSSNEFILEIECCILEKNYLEGVKINYISHTKK
jgi:hypothetical protein